jgi:glycolate oxidase iron-sulfur subunit
MNLREEAASDARVHFRWDDPPREDLYSACVHCGMCLEACPTYTETGLEHQSPRGRVYLIKAVAEGRMEINEHFSDPIFTCLDCRACETACPSNVQVGQLIEEARGQIRQAIPLSGWKAAVQAFFLRGIFPHPRRLRLLGRMTRWYQKSGLGKALRQTGVLKVLPSHLQEMETVLPPIHPPVTQRFPEVIPARGTVRKRVALLTGCVMDVVFAEVHEATVHVLTRNGYEVLLPRGQRCCGALHIHAGDRETGKTLARQNIDAFLAAEVDAILVNAAGCGAALKEYGELLHNDPMYREKAKRFSAKVEDVSRFLYVNGYEKPKGRLDTRVAYHDACHLAHAQGIRLEPRQLLGEIPGVELVEMPEADRCCGSAGIYNLTHPDMAGKLLEEKMRNVPEEADYIAMGNPGCMLQMAVGVRRLGRKQKVVHTLQLLHWSYMKEQDTKN